MRQAATALGSAGATLGFVSVVVPGGSLSFAFAMAGICVMAMVGAYFTITTRAHDGAPIMLGCAAGMAITVLLYRFVPPIFGQETAPVEGLRLYALHGAPVLLLLLAAALAYRLGDPSSRRAAGR